MKLDREDGNVLMIELGMVTHIHPSTHEVKTGELKGLRPAWAT